MKNPAIVFISVAVAVVVFCGVFAWNPPAPRFYPIERVWRMPWDAAPGPAMAWYGRTGCALGAAVVVSGLMMSILRVRDRQVALRLSAMRIYAMMTVVIASLALVGAQIVVEQKDWFKRAPAVHKPDHEY